MVDKAAWARPLGEVIRELREGERNMHRLVPLIRMGLSLREVGRAAIKQPTGWILLEGEAIDEQGYPYRNSGTRCGTEVHSERNGGVRIHAEDREQLHEQGGRSKAVEALSASRGVGPKGRGNLRTGKKGKPRVRTGTASDKNVGRPATSKAFRDGSSGRFVRWSDSAKRKRTGKRKGSKSKSTSRGSASTGR